MIAPRLLTLGLAVLPLLASCSSRPHGELSDEQKLEYYLENAARYYELGEIDRCLDQCQRGLEVDEDNERFLLIKGRCLQHKGTAEDLAAAERLFRDHPAQDDFRIQLGLAGSLERKGLLLDQSAREIASGERYTSAPDPEARAAELTIAAEEAWTEAAQYYAEAEKNWTGSFEALNGQLRVARFQGDPEKAMDFGRALLASIDTSNRLFRTQLVEKEEKGESIVDVRKTLLDNNELELWVRLEMSEMLHGSGRNAEALEQLDKALALDENEPDIHSRRGQLLFQIERYDRAKTSLERYLQLSEEPFDHPDIQRTYELIGRCDSALAGS